MKICKFQETCERDTCPHIVLHDARHTCGTQCTAGRPLEGPCDWVRPCCRDIDGPIGPEERWVG
jgi:hypothetical protein